MGFTLGMHAYGSYRGLACSINANSFAAITSPPVVGIVGHARVGFTVSHMCLSMLKKVSLSGTMSEVSRRAEG